ncbi:MAG: NERD domain-containing protein [Opitutae bacterium]|nr:NERD domain-containing protein [Opitutae bacterium]
MSFVSFIVVYGAVFCVALFGAMAWLKRKRRPKLPFKPERDRLLRGPGESLRQKIQEMDDELVLLLTGLMLGPLVCGLGLLYLLNQAAVGAPGLRLGAAAVTTAVTLWLGALYLGRKGLKRGNHYLGWFGERMTAEELEPLREKGWKIFHDVPVERGGYECNIDHVAVGPGGVFAIETKMRRKGNARPGRKDYEVFYDGEHLSWPWAEDTYGIPQAMNNARDLREWLEQLTGVHVEVTAVLTFPGWFVAERKRGPVRVVHVSFLPHLLTAKADVLAPKQIEIFARQLEARCRDVEY